MTELVQHTNSTDLAAQMDYARAVSSGSMLPQAYRGKPADILLAVGLGQAMGLSPAESLYRIDVIQGKPTASAELIAANVRKAGHKLRVRGDDTTCTATIVRHDDPDFEFTVTRDVTWAKAMGLTQKDNYKKQPGTMLQWRAITAVARLACPEALYGVAYTADEMRDSSPTESAPATRVTAADFVSGGVNPDVVDAEVMANETKPSEVDLALDALRQKLAGPVAEERADTQPAEPMTAKTRATMFALFGDLGIDDRDAQVAGIVHVIGHPIESRGDLTEAEAKAVVARLKEKKAGKA